MLEESRIRHNITLTAHILLDVEADLELTGWPKLLLLDSLSRSCLVSSDKQTRGCIAIDVRAGPTGERVH
jgi:hypothetical protein